jgi:hypothetical protein
MSEPKPSHISSGKSEWQKFKNWVEENSLFIWTSVWILFGLFLGLVGVGIFTDANLYHFGIVVLWAFAYFLVGALIGCIFGVPKSVSNPLNAAGNSLLTAAAAASLSTTTTVPAPVPAQEGTTTPPPVYKGNTNLTEVSDWLTKIVIGAGLVQLKEIPGFVMRVANRMELGVNISTSFHSSILCAGIIVYYVCFGLISGYFVMRTIFLKLI